MSLRSRLDFGSRGMLATIAFYAVVGIVNFAVLFMANFPPHLGVMGILSLIAAYGLFMKRAWTMWVVAMLFFIVTTFAAYTLYYVWSNDAIVSLSALAYLILTWIFTAYIAMKRRVLES
ncbi:MAG TPA: hypothetical protein VMS94_04710 [Acidobacteriota bacterium]|nr:hypothetical protein [Acidobacteriota bacterium]